MTTTEPVNAAGIYWPEPTGFRGRPDGDTTTITGGLPHWQRRISTQGTTYATGVLRTIDGDVPIVVPPTVYSRTGGLLAEDAHLTITGTVDRRGDIHLLAVTDVTEPAGAAP